LTWERSKKSWFPTPCKVNSAGVVGGVPVTEQFNALPQEPVAQDPTFAWLNVQFVRAHIGPLQSLATDSVREALEGRKNPPVPGPVLFDVNMPGHMSNPQLLVIVMIRPLEKLKKPTRRRIRKFMLSLP
jgi:hypothetical protein